jgi:hypothetical protein
MERTEDKAFVVLVPCTMQGKEKSDAGATGHRSRAGQRKRCVLQDYGSEEETVLDAVAP